jgi:hypothetical protein
MPRARNIKPGFFKNDELALCEHGARLLFAGLWCLADREGRLEDRPLRIKGELFPYDNCDIDAWLKQLAARAFITRYEVDGRKFIQINTFAKHQNPHCKEPASTIPAPCAHSSGPADSGFLIPDSGSLKPEGQPAAAESATAKPKEPDKPAEVVDPALEVPPEVAQIWSQWLAYKVERRESYKPQGLRAAITHLREQLAAIGASAVKQRMVTAMASGWKGWDHSRDGPSVAGGNGVAQRKPVKGIPT